MCPYWVHGHHGEGCCHHQLFPLHPISSHSRPLRSLFLGCELCEGSRLSGRGGSVTAGSPERSGIDPQPLFSLCSLWSENGLQLTHRGWKRVLAHAVAVAGQPSVPGLSPVRGLCHHPRVDCHRRALRLRVSASGCGPSWSTDPCLDWAALAWGRIRGASSGSRKLASRPDHHKVMTSAMHPSLSLVAVTGDPELIRGISDLPLLQRRWKALDGSSRAGGKPPSSL